jgi:hypothetical protein
MDVKRGMWSCYFDKTASRAIESIIRARAYSIQYICFFSVYCKLHWIVEEQTCVCGEFSLANPKRADQKHGKVWGQYTKCKRCSGNGL